MPFYDFACESCGGEFNVNASISDMTGRAVPCPECGSTDLRRVYKSINVITKSAPEAPACPNAHVCGKGCAHAH